MTDNDIIKALECCSNTTFISDCAECEMLATDCKDKLIEYALDLITRQKAEIAKKDKAIKSLETIYNTAVDSLAAKIRAEAIKEFVERLKKKSAPTIDPESLLPRGRWKTRGRAIVCSICAEPYFCQDYEKPRYKYCPCCGSKMDVEK